jgi:hypothetical protein
MWHVEEPDPCIVNTDPKPCALKVASNVSSWNTLKPHGMSCSFFPSDLVRFFNFLTSVQVCSRMA